MSGGMMSIEKDTEISDIYNKNINLDILKLYRDVGGEKRLCLME
ncbi:hypothetical protein HNQ34_002528 [Anoxybacillus tepidamans]|uniref:Uncharacterized protein n=1 Tax=Anoxybacteroides tepidamans TaxID=265948 RepID=A0A7W8IRR2_9BACL|nr:hypothetical protein [Anoxybacillus tepidamans]MBB5325427.1 hypothetical protein [Anoxybacillus tepidamans]